MLLLELIIVTILLVASTRFLYTAHSLVGGYYNTIFAILFLYVPCIVLWWRKRPIDFIDSSLKSLLGSLKVFFIVSLIVFPPFLILAHGWEAIVFHRNFAGFAGVPNLGKLALFQLVLVALPEEFFFRGYMQSTLNRIFTTRRQVLGAHVGFSWIVTAAVFAVAHSFIHYQWWHFSIFFPGLVFGWLKERTNSITAPILFHAASNIISDWIARCYY